MLLLQDTGDVVTWGSNEKGQLGLGHYEDVSQPSKVETFSKAGLKMCYIAGGGDLNLSCSEDGQAFAWPFVQNGIKCSLPSRMPFSDKTKIQKVSCGHNFGFFISY
jgi:alpha-tubulin suppressor-like RCC1 family protein